MTNLKSKIAVGLSTAALLATSLAPAAFAGHITIKDNGALSRNRVRVSNVKTTWVGQFNFSKVKNNAFVVQNTGGNKANFNTGDGAVDVDSGDASATIRNTTTTGGNDAEISGCGGCPEDDTDIRIIGNGALSNNKVKVDNSSTTSVFQGNGSFVTNSTFVVQNTGGNTASFNTGGGDVDLTSGNATANITNTTTTGSNSVVIN